MAQTFGFMLYVLGLGLVACVLGLGLESQVLGLGLDLVAYVLGLSLAICVLDSITEFFYIYICCFTVMDNDCVIHKPTYSNFVSNLQNFCYHGNGYWL